VAAGFTGAWTWRRSGAWERARARARGAEGEPGGPVERLLSSRARGRALSTRERGGLGVRAHACGVLDSAPTHEQCEEGDEVGSGPGTVAT
jgi:hypothetical protein